ncbi:protocadherin Fat 4-like [Elysia marginata]|uniref:Protocadherin Fat 4-like n=1 Tax=Elysia marginata TaxID=1093978 RepID=A0AAV4HKV1_9GAST|nr:protocadherin Fat 4-like [Elysia marginata]
MVIFNVNYTDDFPTEWTLQPITVREQVNDTQIVDWSTPEQRKKVIRDDDCGTSVQLAFNENAETKEYFRVGRGPSLFIKKPLDYEAKRQHTLNVTATVISPQIGSQSRYVDYPGQLVINVQDADDRDPIFDAQVYQLELLENGGSGKKVATGPVITAADGDVGINATLEYSVVETDPLLNVTITADGKILVTGPIDREATSAYTIIIKAQQQKNPLASATATVSLTIKDVNDNRPTFSGTQELSATVQETAAAGTHVTWLQASDADEGENALFEYVVNEDSGAFEIRTNPGANLVELVVKNSTLLKGHDSVQVDIRLIERKDVEGGDICDFVSSCGVNITVTIVDVNDNRPVFTQPRYSWDIFNDQEVDVEFAKIQATDDDKGKNAEIRYSVLSLFGDRTPDCLKVRVNAVTGVLTLHEKVMADVTCIYTATACDSPLDPRLRRCANAVVTITVSQSPSTNGSTEVVSYNAHIPEGRAVGSRVMDLPIDGLVTENSNFTIEGRLLKTARVLDREEQDSHIVLAGRRNGAELVEALRITVYVDNVNDNPPLFTSDNYQIQLRQSDEAGQIVLNVSATDEDGDDDIVTFSLLNMKDIFSIDPITGQISLVVSASSVAEKEGEAAALQEGESVLLVEARDSGTPPFKTTANVQVYFPSLNETASIMVPVRKDKLTKDKTGVESKLSDLLSVPVQVIRIESIGSVQDLGSKIFIKQVAQGGQGISSEEQLLELIRQQERAIHAAFAQKYNNENNVNDGDSPGNDDEEKDDDDDDGISLLAIILICLIVSIIIVLLIFAIVFYRTRKWYQREVSVLTKLNKNTSIYDKAPTYAGDSTATHGYMQANTDINQNGSPRRSSVNLVAYTNDAYIADEEEDEPNYSRIREVLGNSRRPLQSNGQSTRYGNGRKVSSPTDEAQEVGPVTEPASTPDLLPANAQSATPDTGEQEEPVYSLARSPRSSTANPVFRTTIDVQYPRLQLNEDASGPVESSRDGLPSHQNSHSNAPEVETRVGPSANWSFRRTCLQQSAANSGGPNERGDFDDLDSKTVSPASSRQRRGSMKAGSESDSGVPSDRDLRLDDETDLETLPSNFGKGSSPIYASIYPSIQRDTDNLRLQPTAPQTDRNGLPPGAAMSFEPEPDYEKRVRFEEAQRRKEMVELPRADTLCDEVTARNPDTEITTF